MATTGKRDDLVRTISAAVDERRDELVALVQELVRIPSLTGEEGEAQKAVAARMRGLDLDTEVWEPDAEVLQPHQLDVGAIDSFENRPNVVGTWKGTGGGRSLILNAHIDTVEAGDPDRWTHAPFNGDVADGKIWGRGSCDMKGGLATYLIAIAALRDAGVAPGGDVIVQSVISEEDGGSGAAAAVLRGYPADGAIITEPTRLAMIPAQGGSVVFRMHVEGKSAHACVRDEGVSAIEKFSLIHQGLLVFEAKRNAEIDHPLYAPIANKIPISIGTIQGGSWPSSVPEWLIAEGRAGLVPGEALDTFRQRFVDEVNRIAKSDPWLAEHPPRIEWHGGQFAPTEVPVDAPISRLILNAHEAVTGSRPEITAATYGADMRHLIHLGDIPCVMYGAGDVRVAHFTDEHVSIDDLVTATKTIAVAVADWCSTETV